MPICYWRPPAPAVLELSTWPAKLVIFEMSEQTSTSLEAAMEGDYGTSAHELR